MISDGPPCLKDTFRETVRGWRQASAMRHRQILSERPLTIPRPYRGRSEKTRLPLCKTAYPRQRHDPPTSLPLGALLAPPTASAPTCPPPVKSPWTTHRLPCHPMTSCWRHPTLTWPDDVMLTSSKKRANNPKSPYFSRFSHFFSFSLKELLLSSAWKLRPSVANLQKSTWRTLPPPTHLYLSPLPAIHQVFTQSILSELSYVHISPELN